MDTVRDVSQIVANFAEVIGVAWLILSQWPRDGNGRHRED